MNNTITTIKIHQSTLPTTSMIGLMHVSSVVTALGKNVDLFILFYFEEKERGIEVHRVLTGGIVMNGVGLCQHQASNAKM